MNVNWTFHAVKSFERNIEYLKKYCSKTFLNDNELFNETIKQNSHIYQPAKKKTIPKGLSIFYQYRYFHKFKSIIFVVIVFSLLLFFNCCTNDTTKDSAKTKSTVVDALVADTQSVDYSLDFSGTLLANESVEICSEVSGRVISINFTEGDIVSKGKLLVKIDDTDLQAELRKIEAQIELAEKENTRNEELYNVKGISLEELEISQSELKVLMAEKDVFEAKIKKTELTAPFSGKIGLRSISVGAYISSSDINRNSGTNKSVET